jgi:serine/threonine-protein kinase
MANNAATNDLLDAAIAEFLEAEARAEAVDRAALVARYASVAGELQAFLADHDRMQRVSAPLRGLVSGSAIPALAGPNDATLDIAQTPFASPTSGNRTGDRIGKYELLGEIGRGGMGVVYKARDTELHRTVALKMVPAGRFASAEDLERFRNEAKLAAGLSHPGIVPIYEADQWQGLPFFAMAYVPGTNLADRLRDGALPPYEAARLLKKIASAVLYAHSQGVIHRDLKPANILLAGSDVAAQADAQDTFEPAITDFGLAKRLGFDHHLTTTGQVLGTPAYMPPEQASGSRQEIGEATDIYALGAILYAMLTGRPPFQAESPVEIILQVMESEPPLPRQLNAAIPRELEAICLKCLEKRPEHRYRSASALVADLDRFLQHEPPEAGQASVSRWLRHWGRRDPVGAWHVAGIAVILLLIQAIYIAHPHRNVAYHLQICGILVGWLVVCLVLQFLARRPPLRQGTQFALSIIDAAFLTGLLASLTAPLGLLLGGYFLLVGASGLFFRTRLVTFATTAAMLASVVLFLLRPEEARPLHYTLLFETALAITGFVVGYQVWRFGVLREYYEERRE